MTIAYLNTEYPSLSHTFIEREVRALRSRGLSIRTFSVRKPGATGTLGSEHIAAAKETTYLLDSSTALVLAAIGQAIRSPGGAMRAIARALNMAPPGLKAAMQHLAYVAEALRLAAELRRANIRHIHVHMANNGAAVALLACEVNRSLTYSLTIHGSAEFFHVDTWTLKPKVENAKFVRAISNFCRAQIMAWSDPRCWDRLHMVHCGVDLKQYAPMPRTPSSKLRLLTVGRLHSIKGYPLLLKACRGLTDTGIDWSLDMVGDGPERPALELLVREQGIESRVSFSGAVGQDRIQSHFDNADVMVISSFMEGVPVVLMEAMAKGRAVLATAVGGIPELVTPGQSGELVPPGSSDAIREGLLKLHAERNLFDAYGKAGRAKIEAEFSIEQTADQMASLFRRYSVCSESESRPISPSLALHPIA